MRVLVCGGRDFADWPGLKEALDDFHRTKPITLLIHGDARGADYWADTWAKQKGIQRAKFPAPWDVHRQKAGPMRNAAMLDAIRPDLVIAFPGGAGTRDMVNKARAAGVPIRQVEPSQV